MRRYLQSVFIVIQCIIFCAAADATERGSWSEVQGLEKGLAIKVSVSGGKPRKGSFAELTDTTLKIVEGSSETALKKDEVLRVEVRSSARRVRNTLIAAGVGLAIGLVIDQTLGALFRNESGEDTGTRVATVALPPALLGGIAAAFPAYRTVYRAPKGHR